MAVLHYERKALTLDLVKVDSSMTLADISTLLGEGGTFEVNITAFPSGKDAVSVADGHYLYKDDSGNFGMIQSAILAEQYEEEE